MVVFKVGSNSLSVDSGKFLNIALFCALVETICALRDEGHDVVLVSSGAVSVGCLRLNMKTRPTSLITKQAIAAVGQSRLMRVYDDFFAHRDQPIAQVLLSRENLSDKHHYNNALNTFSELLRLGIVPIVNENDTVAVEELRFGDNDTLSARVASLLQADWLFLLTDVDALYTANPNEDPTATPIHVVPDISQLKVSTNNAGSQWGTGGMQTKIEAATIASAAGVSTVVMHSRDPMLVFDVLAGDRSIGTLFEPRAAPLVKSHKKWIAHARRIHGTLHIDDGAVQAIRRKKSLFAAGVQTAEGDFPAGSCVAICDTKGVELARGVCNYSSAELPALLGKQSGQFSRVLGGSAKSMYIVDRDNLALTLGGPLGF